MNFKKQIENKEVKIFLNPQELQVIDAEREKLHLKTYTSIIKFLIFRNLNGGVKGE